MKPFFPYIDSAIFIQTPTHYRLHLIKVISERFQSHFSEYALKILK